MTSRKIPKYFVNFLILTRINSVDYLVFKESNPKGKYNFICCFIGKNEIENLNNQTIKNVLYESTYDLISINENDLNKTIQIDNKSMPLTISFNLGIVKYKIYIIRIDGLDVSKYESNQKILNKIPTTGAMRKIDDKLTLIPLNSFINGNFYLYCDKNNINLTILDKDNLKKILTPNIINILTKNINQNILNVQNINIIRLCQEVFKNNSLNIPVELEQRQIQNESSSKSKNKKGTVQKVTIETYKSK